MSIDIEQLREDLLDYFGTAAFGPFPSAIIDYGDVENASPEELIVIARQNGFDLRKYEVLER